MIYAPEAVVQTALWCCAHRGASGDRQRALFAPGYRGEERGTHEPHLLRHGSLYVKASERPTRTAAMMLGTGVVATMLRRLAAAEE